MWYRNMLFDAGLLGCDTVWTCRWVQTFGRNTLPPSSALKTETVCSSEHWYSPVSLHGVTTQKTINDIFSAVRTSNLRIVLDVRLMFVDCDIVLFEILK
jgi:hypothetical protein